jgi:hypothetical protein
MGGDDSQRPPPSSITRQEIARYKRSLLLTGMIHFKRNLRNDEKLTIQHILPLLLLDAEMAQDSEWGSLIQSKAEEIGTADKEGTVFTSAVRAKPAEQLFDYLQPFYDKELQADIVAGYMKMLESKQYEGENVRSPGAYHTAYMEALRQLNGGVSVALSHQHIKDMVSKMHPELQSFFEAKTRDKTHKEVVDNFVGKYLPKLQQVWVTMQADPARSSKAQKETKLSKKDREELEEMRVIMRGQQTALAQIGTQLAGVMAGGRKGAAAANNMEQAAGSEPCDLPGHMGHSVAECRSRAARQAGPQSYKGNASSAATSSPQYGGADSICDVCDIDHRGGECYAKNPAAAPPGWRPSRFGNRRRYEVWLANTEKLKAGSAASTSYHAVPPPAAAAVGQESIKEMVETAVRQALASAGLRVGGGATNNSGSAASAATSSGEKGMQEMMQEMYDREMEKMYGTAAASLQDDDCSPQWLQYANQCLLDLCSPYPMATGAAALAAARPSEDPVSFTPAPIGGLPLSWRPHAREKAVRFEPTLEPQLFVQLSASELMDMSSEEVAALKTRLAELVKPAAPREMEKKSSFSTVFNGKEERAAGAAASPASGTHQPTRVRWLQDMPEYEREQYYSRHPPAVKEYIRGDGGDGLYYTEPGAIEVCVGGRVVADQVMIDSGSNTNMLNSSLGLSTVVKNGQALATSVGRTRGVSQVVEPTLRYRIRPLGHGKVMEVEVRDERAALEASSPLYDVLLGNHLFRPNNPEIHANYKGTGKPALVLTPNMLTDPDHKVVVPLTTHRRPQQGAMAAGAGSAQEDEGTAKEEAGEAAEEPEQPLAVAAAWYEPSQHPEPRQEESRPGTKVEGATKVKGPAQKEAPRKEEGSDPARGREGRGTRESAGSEGAAEPAGRVQRHKVAKPTVAAPAAQDRPQSFRAQGPTGGG